MGVSSLFYKISIPVTFQLTELSLNLIPSLIPTIFALTLLVSLVVLHVFRVMNTSLGIPIKLWISSKGIYTHTLSHQKLQTILKGLLTPPKSTHGPQLCPQGKQNQLTGLQSFYYLDGKMITYLGLLSGPWAFSESFCACMSLVWEPSPRREQSVTETAPASNTLATNHEGRRSNSLGEKSLPAFPLALL